MRAACDGKPDKRIAPPHGISELDAMGIDTDGTSDVPDIETGLATIAQILAQAELLAGNADSALQWFQTQPIPGHEGLTAMELVASGQSVAVLKYLQELRDGAYP